MEYRFCRSFSDENSVYDSVFRRVYHKCVPKKTGITNTIERLSKLSQNVKQLVSLRASEAFTECETISELTALTIF